MNPILLQGLTNIAIKPVQSLDFISSGSIMDTAIPIWNYYEGQIGTFIKNNWT